jgi:hypothetical protein
MYLSQSSELKKLANTQPEADETGTLCSGRWLAMQHARVLYVSVAGFFGLLVAVGCKGQKITDDELSGRWGPGCLIMPCVFCILHPVRDQFGTAEE